MKGLRWSSAVNIGSVELSVALSTKHRHKESRTLIEAFLMAVVSLFPIAKQHAFLPKRDDALRGRWSYRFVAAVSRHQDVTLRLLSYGKRLANHCRVDDSSSVD